MAEILEINVPDPDGKVRLVPCEVYSRVVGYFRPVSQWNKGKQAEFNSRVEYRIKEV